MSKRCNKDWIRDEKGQILVLFALLLAVMLACVGIVVDVGYFYVQKQKMQNGVDASALGGVQVIIDNQRDVVNIAKEVAEKNGLVMQNVTVTLPTTNTIKVDYFQNFAPFFLQNFGLKSIKLEATATAQATVKTSQQSSIFNYVLFTGNRSKNLNIVANNHVVDGPVHINGDFFLLGSNHSFNDRLEVTGSYFSLGLFNRFHQVIRSAPYIDLPSFDANDYRRRATRIINSSTLLITNLVEVNGILFVDGNVTILGDKLRGRGTIVATGNILISGKQLEYSSKDDLVSFYSLGNISFSNAGTFHGWYFAPRGTISFLGNKASTVHGALIASEVDFSGDGYRFTHDARFNSTATEKSFKLIK